MKKIKMDKIIKPLLNEDGTQVIRKIKNGEWYFNNDRFLEWCNSIDDSTLKYPIYYAEEWMPEENENYWYYSFDDYTNYTTKYQPNCSKSDRRRISIGNVFKTQEEAMDIKNILKIFDNMKKYYQVEIEVQNEN